MVLVRFTTASEVAGVSCRSAPCSNMRAWPLEMHEVTFLVAPVLADHLLDQVAAVLRKQSEVREARPWTLHFARPGNHSRGVTPHCSVW